MKNKVLTSMIFLPVLFFFALPVLTYATPSPNNNNVGITYECGSNTDGSNTAGNCDFSDLVAATRKVINWGIGFALSFSVIIIAYAGYKYLTSGDSSKQRDEANAMLQNVAIGIAWVLAAWLIVNLITNALLGKTLDKIFQ